MPRNNADIEEPLLSDTQIQSENGNNDITCDLAASGRNQPIVSDGGEPLRGDVRLNQATATLAATIIGKCI
jgi:hypothetical protein